ncbi:MAG: hypothetical protein FWC43_00635 [Planctomycetaceae bacterium]|nr:hypothetical protein [Planctomycetaceae bacterium]
MSRQLLFAILIILLFLGFWWGLWSLWKRDLLHSEKYRLAPERFHLSEPPPWIPTTLVHDALTAAKLGPQESVLDAELPEKLAAAFAANPWIERVRKVQIRYPAEVYVELDYRSPVCLVELPNGNGFYPVDANGILLPPNYFMQGSEEEIAEKMNAFPYVVGTPSNQIGSLGDPWGDSSVEKAAKIAAMLGSDAKIGGVASIRILAEPRDGSFTIRWNAPPPEFQLVATNGRVFHWGTFEFSPKNPHLPDLKEEAKLETFRKLISVHGTLDQFPVVE